MLARLGESFLLDIRPNENVNRSISSGSFQRNILGVNKHVGHLWRIDIETMKKIYTHMSDKP